MEKYFGNAYRGDPGVPHADPDRFVSMWIGSATFSVLTYFNPYMWTLSNQFNWLLHLYPEVFGLCFMIVTLVPFVYSNATFRWHDKAFLYEQYHWKQARKKNQPYEFLWNKTWDKVHREHYYYNWPVYFP